MDIKILNSECKTSEMVLTQNQLIAIDKISCKFSFQLNINLETTISISTLNLVKRGKYKALGIKLCQLLP